MKKPCSCGCTKTKSDIELGDYVFSLDGGFYAHTKVISCARCGKEADRVPYLCPALSFELRMLLTA